MLARQVLDAFKVDKIEKISPEEEGAVIKVQGNIKRNEGPEAKQYHLKGEFEHSAPDLSGSKEKKK